MKLITTDTFQLQLPQNWCAQETDDPEQFSFSVIEKEINVTISTFTFSEEADLFMMANKLVDLRMNAEMSAANSFDRKMEVAEPQILPSDRGFDVQYFGRDDTGRQFRYFGIVNTGKLLNIFVESNVANLDQLEEVLQDVFSGLQF